MSIFATDAVGSVLHGALNGISLRQDVIADNIANVDADAEQDTLVFRDPGISVDHRVLDFACAGDSVHGAAELNDRAVAGPLDHATVVDSYCRVD